MSNSDLLPLSRRSPSPIRQTPVRMPQPENLEEVLIIPAAPARSRYRRTVNDVSSSTCLRGASPIRSRSPSPVRQTPVRIPQPENLEEVILLSAAPRRRTINADSVFSSTFLRDVSPSRSRSSSPVRASGYSPVRASGTLPITENWEVPAGSPPRVLNTRSHMTTLPTPMASPMIRTNIRQDMEDIVDISLELRKLSTTIGDKHYVYRREEIDGQIPYYAPYFKENLIVFSASNVFNAFVKFNDYFILHQREIETFFNLSRLRSPLTEILFMLREKRVIRNFNINHANFTAIMSAIEKNDILPYMLREVKDFHIY